MEQVRLGRKRRKRLVHTDNKSRKYILYTFYTLMISLFFARGGSYFTDRSLAAGLSILWVRAQQFEVKIPELSAAEAEALSGGAAVVGYDIQMDDGRNGPYRFVLGGDRSANTLATSVLLTAEQHGLEQGLTYRVSYRAVNVIGVGPWSEAAYLRAATLPLAPPSPTVAAFDVTTIDLELHGTSNDGGTTGTVFSYKLHCDEGSEGTPFHTVTAYDGSALTYQIVAGDRIDAAADATFTGLFTLGKIYTFKFTAVNEVGDSELRYPAPTTRIALGRSPLTPTQPVVVETGSSETIIKL